MDYKNFNTSENDLDRRIDKVIRNFLPGLPLSLVYKNIRNGFIKVNSRKTKENYRIQKNDVINIAAHLFSQSDDKKDCTKKAHPLDKKYIILQTPDLLFINKPYDLLVHGSETSLDQQVKDYYRENFKDQSLSFNPGPLHRLDRKTTGILTFSLSLKGARYFSENIKTHKIKKEYLAVLEGHLKNTLQMEDYISKGQETEYGFNRVKVSHTQENANEKLALTRAIPLTQAYFNKVPVTLAKILIESGRTHQIRSQCASRGYPLLGDTAYGGSKLTAFKQDFFLHARCLTFEENKKEVTQGLQPELPQGLQPELPQGLPPEITAPLPSEFENFLNYCGIKNYRL